MFGWFKKKEAGPPSEIGRYHSVETDLVALMRGHGLEVQTHNGWALSDGERPALRGGYRLSKQTEENTTLGLDLELRLPCGRSIIEHYAGAGATPKAALDQCMIRFCIGTFHVFLSAYWQHDESDQVEIERWTINNKPWDAYVGNMINQASEGQKAGTPGNYLPTVQTAISAMPLTPEDHWFSFYGFNLKGDLTMDAYWDNDKWPEVNQTLAALDWPPAEGFYGTRNFILLRPAKT